MQFADTPARSEGPMNHVILRSVGVGILLFCACALFSVSAIAFDLNGNWSTEPSNCDKIFEMKNNVVSFTHNAEVFGDAFIVEGDRLRGPGNICKITNRKETNGILHLIASCTTNIAALGTQELSAKIDNDNQITRIFPSFPQIGIPYFRCKF